MSKNRTLLLILVCLALGVLVFLDNRGGGDDGVVGPSAPARERTTAAVSEDASAPAADADAPVAPGIELINPLTSFDTSLLTDWTERPLFAPSRKRPAGTADAAPRAAAQVQAAPPPAYDLLGIVRDGGRAIALLRKKGDGTSFRVEVGDMIGGWRVARMETASVVLERADGTSQTVPLSRE